MVQPDILRHLAFFRGLSRPVLDLICEQAEIREYDNSAIICNQHDRAIAVFFLLSGTVQFLVRVEGGEDLLVGVGRDTGLLVGWAVFRAPYRYTTTVRCEQECRFLRVPHHVFDQILEQDKESCLLLLRRVTEAMAQRLEFERDMLVDAAARSGMQAPPAVESGHNWKDPRRTESGWPRRASVCEGHISGAGDAGSGRRVAARQLRAA